MLWRSFITKENVATKNNELFKRESERMVFKERHNLQTFKAKGKRGHAQNFSNESLT